MVSVPLAQLELQTGTGSEVDVDELRGDHDRRRRRREGECHVRRATAVYLDQRTVDERFDVRQVASHVNGSATTSSNALYVPGGRLPTR